jgi:hypothetical protein
MSTKEILQEEKFKTRKKPAMSHLFAGRNFQHVNRKNRKKETQHLYDKKEGDVCVFIFIRTCLKVLFRLLILYYVHVRRHQLYLKKKCIDPYLHFLVILEHS